MDEDARTKCKTYAAHLSSVGASSELLLCVSLILILRLIPLRRLSMGDNGEGWSASQPLGDNRGLLGVDQDASLGKVEVT